MDLLALPSVGALCALGSAFTWAVTSMLARTLHPPLNSVSINAIRSTVAGVVLLGWVVAVDGVGVMTSMSATTFGLLALSIAIAVGVGDNFFFESSRTVGLASAMTIATSYPLITTVLAALVLGETITMWVVGGGVLTLAGVVLIVTGAQRRAERHEHYGRGVAAAVLASLAWGIAPILMKAPLQEMDAAAIQSVRLPVAAALLWVTPWARGAVRQLVEGGQGIVGRMALLSLLTVFSSVMYVAGIKYAGVAVGSILSSVAPMFAIPLGVIFLQERLSTGAVLGILVTIVGVIVLQF
ncbi:MAG: DMT family transporter [Candidatus Rokuibacteriota bacterium]